MGKPRTKRQIIREERKQKRQAAQEANIEAKHDAKRRRSADEEAPEGEPAAKRRHDEGDGYHAGEYGQGYDEAGHGGRPEREFFGMLADEEQEYFRRADELLELNQFPSEEDRHVFLQSVYREAVGKELKLASSQSLSRLMERLILLSSTRQKKRIFGAFAGHFMTLVQHRFASHCCEALFLQSAPVVSRELGAEANPSFVVDTKGAGKRNNKDGDGDEEGDAEGEGEEEEPENAMENLFLLTLDEFEEHLSFLMTDRFASHTLRVLLVVLSGRPLEDSATKSLLKSKKKEHISVQGAPTNGPDEQVTQLRPVPVSFTMATRKIISDATSGMDLTTLRVLVKHPTGNPLLQLLLELDIALNHKDKSAEADNDTLLHKLLPGAPQSLNEADSQASDFVNSMIYEPIGSRLLETLIAHCPGKIFKAMSLNILGPRIGTYCRNDVASYPAIRALNRFSKDDLVAAVGKILPVMPVLVSKGRYNVVRTLLERCQARGAHEQLGAITKALVDALGSNSKELVPKLCALGEHAEEGEDAKKPKFQQDAPNKAAMATHGAHLASAMLATPGSPSKAAQGSLLALSSEQLEQLATRSMPSVTVLTTALDRPPAPNNEFFHKALVSALVPRAGDLATDKFGHNVVNAIAAVPAGGKGRSVPFHVKQTIMGKLASREAELRESWMGRSVWRTWRGDMWKARPADWTSWAREMGLEEGQKDGVNEKGRPLKPWERMREKKEARERAEREKRQQGGTTSEADNGLVNGSAKARESAVEA